MIGGARATLECVARTEISDEAWAVIGPLFPLPRVTGRPPVQRRAVVEATAWRFRTGAPWRDVPERFGNWSTIYKNFNRWSEQGIWVRVLEKVQSLAHQRGELDWVASIDSTIVRVHQHGATLTRDTGGARSNYKKFGAEPPDHAIGRSRGGLTTKNHLGRVAISIGGRLRGRSRLRTSLPSCRIGMRVLATA